MSQHKLLDRYCHKDAKVTMALYEATKDLPPYNHTHCSICGSCEGSGVCVCWVTLFLLNNAII